MRSRKVIRYYCDFCSRGMFRKPDMEKHERGCTANPNRVCGLCERVGEITHPFEKLIEALHEGGIDGLSKLVESCPACMLAGTRAANKLSPSEPYWFDYKAAHEAWWKETNDMEYRNRSY